MNGLNVLVSNCLRYFSINRLNDGVKISIMDTVLRLSLVPITCIYHQSIFNDKTAKIN